MAATLRKHLLLFLLVFLLPSSTIAAEFWNIDCGSSEGFTDTINRTWLGDDGFVISGESHEIRDGMFTGTYKTLRAFPKNKKNCYVIPVGKDKKIYVRAGFHYGNYDGKEKPPTFELLFESNDWGTVNMSKWSGGVQYAAFYVTKSSSINICLGRLYDDQDPLINSIMVTVLQPSMYSSINSSYALYGFWRFAMGASDTIRYPDDNYDREWKPSENSSLAVSNYVIFNSNVSTVNISTSVDDPPVKLFRTAITSAEESKNLTFTTSFLGSDPVDIYINMYFSEVFNFTGLGRKRSFYICKDNEPISDSFTLTVGNVLELSGAMLKASENTTFSLVPANDSVLPPIISGFELLGIKRFSQQRSYSRDVNALSVLQQKFIILQNWTGDPCLPSDYNWEWVNCSSDDSPRIISLFLGGYGLRGSLPDFSNLDALQTIDLHNNSLTGSVPEFLAQLPKLRSLNLAYNNFNKIPASIRNKGILLNIRGNPLLDTTEAPALTPPSQTPPAPSRTGSNRVYDQSLYMYTSMLMIAALL